MKSPLFFMVWRYKLQYTSKHQFEKVFVYESEWSERALKYFAFSHSKTAIPSNFCWYFRYFVSETSLFPGLNYICIYQGPWYIKIHILEFISWCIQDLFLWQRKKTNYLHINLPKCQKFYYGPKWAQEVSMRWSISWELNHSRILFLIHTLLFSLWLITAEINNHICQYGCCGPLWATWPISWASHWASCVIFKQSILLPW